MKDLKQGDAVYVIGRLPITPYRVIAVDISGTNCTIREAKRDKVYPHLPDQDGALNDEQPINEVETRYLEPILGEEA